MDTPSGTPEPQRPSLRVADVDRERVADVLRRNFEDGRLTYTEFQERLEAAYGARTFADLEPLTADLPATASSPVPAPTPPTGTPVPRQRTRNHVITYVTVMVFLVLIWALTGMGYFWPIWPILGWGLLVVLDVFGVSHSSRRSTRRRRHHW